MRRICPVSVVIPFYNGHETITRAVRSVMFQSLPPAEVIVVDDGSPNPLRPGELAVPGNVKVLRHGSNKGIPFARNTGIRAASQEWIAFLDQDDAWTADKLERQWTVVREFGREVAVWGNMLVVEEVNRKTNPVHLAPRVEIARALDASPSTALRVLLEKGGNVIPFGSLMVHKGLFEKVGLLDERLLGGSDDYDFVIRLAAEGVPFRNVDVWVPGCGYSIVHYIHGDNYSNEVKFFSDGIALIERLADKYPEVAARTRPFLARRYYVVGRYHHQRGAWSEAVAYYRGAVQFQPLWFRPWVALVAGLLPSGVHGALTRMLRFVRTLRRRASVSRVLRTRGHRCGSMD